MPEMNIDRTIDARGAACPGPTMELIKAMKAAEVGAVVEILSSDKMTTVDGAAWLSKVGQEMVAATDKGGYWSIIAKKIK
ncbi:MAG: sulfurtransferase TusA family protein [Nitrospirota bacterium]